VAADVPLDCLKKRDLLNDRQAPRAKFLAAAESHLAAGLIYDAVDFWNRAGEAERLKELAGQAVESGDLFLYLHALKAAHVEPEAERLKELARRAEAAGQLFFAKRARKLTGTDEKADGE